MGRALRREELPEPMPIPVRAKKAKAVNDLDLARWKDYGDLWVDSLWMIPERDSSGAHTASYHGNFVPQIPYQMIRRYTKQGDSVLDIFAGSGTTLIESVRAGRHALGIELLDHVADAATSRARSEANPHGSEIFVARGDCRAETSREAIREKLQSMGKEQVQLVMAHPPYHDIIRFSEKQECLSNAESTEAFTEMYAQAVENVKPLLEDGRYLCLVIGDKYTEGEWVPLGFNLMQATMEAGFKLKSLIVKNMAGNRAKRNLEQLWRFRALSGGFFVFKHEYVMVFEKRKATRSRGATRKTTKGLLRAL